MKKSLFKATLLLSASVVLTTYHAHFVSAETTTVSETTVVSDDDALKDGTYTVYGNEDERGWTVRHTIVVKDGKIVESDFDYYNAEGKRKTEDEEYNDMMKEKNGVSSKEAIEQLNAALVELQDEDDIEVVTGATHTYELFEDSSEALIEKAKNGDTQESNFQDVELVDGEYSLKTTEDERGWAHTFTIVVKDGKITESNYDMVNASGELKSESDEYNDAMKESSKVSFAEAVKELNEELVDEQNIIEIEVVAGATSTTNSFKEYAQKLIDAAVKGDTKLIEITL